MINCEIIKRGKRASLTVEMAIGIFMATVILFVAIGMFNGNLATMASSNKVDNLFNNTNKTSFATFNRDYSNPINVTDSQTNVQTLGDQANQLLTDAITTIDTFKKNPPKNENDVEDLAKAATIALILGGSSDTPGTGLAKSDEAYFKDQYGIQIIRYMDTFVTQVTKAEYIGLEINKQFVYAESIDDGLKTLKDQVDAAKEIKKASYTPIPTA